MDGAPMAERRRKIHAGAHKITKRLAQFKKLLYLCTRIKFVFVIKIRGNDLAVTAGRFFCCFFPFLWCKTDKKSKKMQKNKKKCEKICIYQKKAVPLHRI